jgi:hypothetical protein
MVQRANDERWHLLRQVAGRKTTESFKRTINAAILLRVARASPWAAAPRKVNRMMTFLGFAGLLVVQHEASLRTFIHHIPL